jgi:UDP-N-acetylmuramoyl-tripeptide--D-alanyl-D-alanine ligase
VTRRALGRLRRDVRLRALRAAAFVWRRLMLRTTVVALTGSVGKTTAKECLAAILSARFPSLATRNNENDAFGIPRTLLRLRPWHRVAVIEIGAGSGPGTMRGDARLVRPDVAIVLAVARTHTNVFADLDETAAEKGALVEALSARGLAILNGDDARVRRMAERCRGRVETFGRTPGDAWADEVSSRWPERLALRVHLAGEALRVETRLVGTHWLNGVLAALLAARAVGVGPADAAAALARVEPFTARMQPVRLPNGATVIRDEMNSSPDTWGAALDVLRAADARRRVLVASDLSDSGLRPRVRLRELGEQAAGAADVALFVGEHARYAVRAAVARGMDPAHVEAVVDVPTAAARLAALLREGDVALLKGRATHHLSRILFAQLGPIGCWTPRCRKRIACDVCAELRPAFDLTAALAGRGAGPA